MHYFIEKNYSFSDEIYSNLVIKSHFWNSNNDEGIKEKYKL